MASEKGPFSERQFAESSGISRAGLRHIMAKDQNITLKSIIKIASYLDRKVHLLAINPESNTELSTIAVSLKVIENGENSWKIHFMDMVDEFRRSLDPQLLLLAPSKKLPYRLKALLASIVSQLCEENNIDPPTWAANTYFLEKPWFVSGMQSLKALAILESPLSFRRNNIFVHENFLERV